MWTKNVSWQRTDFYCLLPPFPSLFHPWPWRRAFSSTPSQRFCSCPSPPVFPLFFLTIPHPPLPFLSLQAFFLIWRLVLFLCVFNCYSFYQPSFLWLVLAISFLCSERFMLNYFSDQLLKLGSMLSKKTEKKGKTKTSRKPFRIKYFFQE